LLDPRVHLASQVMQGGLYARWIVFEFSESVIARTAQ
jgi:hypothetical protein